MDQDLLKQFEGRQYLNLTTFRKNGMGVPTPVWFVEDGNRLYVITGAKSGKVKRIRRNSAVKVVPCNSRGTPTGDWLDMEACLATEEEGKKIEQLYRRKYGLTRFFFSLAQRFSHSENVTLVLTLKDV